MSIRLSNRASLVAVASFVLALGTMVGPGEGQAHAQRGARPKTQKPHKKDKGKDRAREKREADAAAAAAAEEEKRKAGEAQPAADPKTDPKVAPQTEPSAATDDKKQGEAAPEEQKEELDTSVEVDKAIYFSGDLAFTRSDLGVIADNSGFDRTAANGVLYGLAAGLRLKDLRFGVRWRVYDTTEFALWNFSLSAGYGLPLRPVSPVFSAHLGYVFDQSIEPGLFTKSLPEGTQLPPNVDVKGILAGVDVNASYWVTRFLRLGLFIGFDLMFLSREKAALPQSIYGVPPETPNNPLFSDSGTSLGLNMNAGLRGAFDIGFK
ncbi:MAG TPA: hypothetical protein VM925_16010 [Labilithrix sp.]|nr:hypothetical protein [Labilithrix sp.]